MRLASLCLLLLLWLADAGHRGDNKELHPNAFNKQYLEWHTSWSSARRAAAKNGRPLLVLIYSNSCPACINLERSLRNSAEFELLARFFNLCHIESGQLADQQEEFAREKQVDDLTLHEEAEELSAAAARHRRATGGWTPFSPPESEGYTPRLYFIDAMGRPLPIVNNAIEEDSLLFYPRANDVVLGMMRALKETKKFDTFRGL